MRKFLFFIAFIANLGGLAWAESPLAERRVIVTRDMDFPGRDLQSIFDTSMAACESACLLRDDCAAYTFNTRSNACFLKSAVAERLPFAGAFSAEVLTRPQSLVDGAEARALAAPFLNEADLAAAAERARALPHDYVTGDWSAADLARWSREAEAEADLTGALRYMAAAAGAGDQAQDWTDYARLANATARAAQKSEGSGRFKIAFEAAIGGYLRAASAPQEANALTEMAIALENLGRGRDAIDALRLAQARSPRDDTLRRIERLVGFYGFRLVESRADSDAESPRICATFSEVLSQVGVDYAPFVQSDTPGLVVEARGQELCIAGMSHGERHVLTLRAGLPAASGEVLAKPVTLTHYVRDRSASVHFPGRAYVLAPSPDAGLPLVAVNVGEVGLRLSRLSDRNLVRAFQEQYFGRSLSAWEIDYFNEGMAEEVWTGTAELETTLNRDVTTRLPIGEAIAGQPPGVYVLTARVPGVDPYEVPPASQWFVISDIGVSTLMGADGLHVLARSINTAEALAGVEVELLSTANAVLGRVTTDAQGQASFDPGQTSGAGAAAPAMVVLRHGEDIAFLSLSEPEFDLSDRGVEGHPAAPPIDVFVSTDRGAYRAGETVHVTALARDARAAAIEGLPLTAILTRPDGVEYARETSAGVGAGGHVFALPIGASAPRGTWRLGLFADPEAEALASQNFLVEDFLPERIDVALALSEPRPRAGTRPALDVTARYLFGAPGADLALEGDVRLRPAATLEGWPGYRFGLAEVADRVEWASLGEARTDTDGAARLAVPLPEIDAAGAPLEALITLRVKEGSGRPVERTLTVPVAPDGPIIGIRPDFEGELPEGAEARFDLVALSPELAPVAMPVAWELNRVETRYQWYRTDGNWFWDPVTTRSRVASGRAELGAEPVRVSAPTDWGRYELVVTREGGAYLASSTEFFAGWYAAADATTTPDMLDVSLDRAAYKPGDTATLRFVPRAAGKAVITVVSNRLIDMVTLEATEGENVVALPVTEDWGAGAYVTATLIQPMATLAGRTPVRALGLTHAAVDPGARQLVARLDVADEAAPRGPLEVVLNVAGGTPGERVFATIAAVDVGILNLTSFAPPDPSDHYFGQRRLGVGMRDLYGRLIDGQTGAMGRLRSGGDGMAQMRMQAPPPTEELMAQVSGVVEVIDGTARVEFDLPEFNGTVRLMALVWSATGVGNASEDVLVRDPVVLTASLPRFLAPGDSARMLLELTHAKGPAGMVHVSARAEGVEIDGGRLERDVTLAEGGTARLSVPIRAGAAGVHEIALSLTTPEGGVLSKRLRLPVALGDPEVARTRRLSLAPGARLELGPDLLAGLLDGRVSVTAGPLARFDAGGLLARLDAYPYGCTEQQTSRALPLLAFTDMAGAFGLGTADDLAERIEGAIAGVLANQSSGGGFGLWRPGAGDLWLDAYVGDFLSRARADGYGVPDTAFRAAMDNLRNRVNYHPDFETGGEALAYALYVLAREGAAAMGDLRYYADVKEGAFATPLATAQLGAALAAYGDQRRADRLFARAGQQLSELRPEAADWRSDYGTTLRDNAAVLALAVEAGSRAVDRDALIAQVTRGEAHLSTQEASWSLMAARALLDEVPGLGLAFDGAALSGPVLPPLGAGELAGGRLLANTGTEAVELTLNTFGVPEAPEPASGNGITIERRYFTLEGDPVNPAEVTQGTRLVTVLSVTPWAPIAARLMVADPLPAGFEIDNPNLLRAGDIRALDWLEVLDQTATTEFRQDRFLAAVDWRSDRPFRLAYVVRAVTPGSFRHPAASVEDMYRPSLRAVGEAGAVRVSE